jgi:predicted Fe-Mo cluster-binding NifX family protein
LKIAVSAMQASLDSDIDLRFGRCRYFLIIDPQTMQFEAVENVNGMASGGAGIVSAQMVASKGVEAVLTGNCGPNAFQVLSTAGVQVIAGVSGKVQDAVDSYKAGKLKASCQPNVAGHFGLGHGGGGCTRHGMSRRRGNSWR